MQRGQEENVSVQKPPGPPEFLEPAMCSSLVPSWILLPSQLRFISLSLSLLGSAPTWRFCKIFHRIAQTVSCAAHNNNGQVLHQFQNSSLRFSNSLEAVILTHSIGWLWSVGQVCRSCLWSIVPHWPLFTHCSVYSWVPSWIHWLLTNPPWPYTVCWSLS